MPFWPGAKVTTPFGLRNSQYVINMSGSIAHLGTDRAGGKVDYLTMPFDGIVKYKMITQAGGWVISLFVK